VKLIVGLGNPGKSYVDTRHNAGFACVEYVFKKWNIDVWEKRRKVLIGRGVYLGEEVVLCKPRTYMNNSGIAIDYLLRRFGCSACDIVIVYDDMNLPIETIRLRRTGGSGGQNGVSSVIEVLGSETFDRIKVGIGSHPLEQDAVEYVLSPFTESENQKLVKTIIPKVCDALESLITDGMGATMNRFN
jgi:PTH1 family peptidyl-tRNA hydrolase